MGMDRKARDLCQTSMDTEHDWLIKKMFFTRSSENKQTKKH